MNYDSYGNRTQSNWQTAACSPTSDPATASYNAANRVTWTTVNSAVNGFTYDAAGNVTNDGANQYLYDGEGRVCAVQTNSISGGAAIYGYIYDAEGRRVAKGSLATFSCDLGSNGFTLTESYVLGQSGEQLTTLDGSQNWERTNVYGGGQLLATYDTVGLHFQLTDPLGTRRVQASAVGQAEEDCQGLPFGDGLNCYSVASAPATADDSTPLHFTGKERDTESGNDYFGARYYGSTMGRFMSPDPSNLSVDFWLPQTWNRYTYGLNNPLTMVDKNGLWPWYVHWLIDDSSFPGMSKQDLKTIKDASWNMDFAPGQQDPSNAYQHGMQDGSGNVGGSPATMQQDARQQADDFISQQVAAAQQAQANWEAQGHSGIAPAALTAFGNALHTAQDRTSPSHQGEQPWANKPWYSKDTLSHVWRERWPSNNQWSAAQSTSRSLFQRTFGDEFDWMFFKNGCAQTEASDSQGNSTGWSGCQ